MKKIIISIILILIISEFQIGFSQTVKILDKSDLQPINNVSIYNAQKTKTVNSDIKGNADISLFDENDTLYFTHISYQLFAISKKDIGKLDYKILLTENIIKLDEIVFSANKAEEAKKDVANKIEIIPAEQITFNNPQTSADLLQQTGNVFVQQSQMGGGSPVLRGFEANKVLLVVDGVRMNNAIYRGGHLQNVITIDPNMLERVEVVFGPGSVIYGSDALGGVMHFYTKNPILTTEEKPNLKLEIFKRYSTANQEQTGNVTFNLGFKKIGFLTSVTYKDLGDLRTGSVRETFFGNYPDWGKRLWYVERIDGKDTMITNPDPNIQKGTGYSQYDILQKILFKPNENAKYTLNVQFSTSSDIPRYDRLTQESDGKPKYAEWYYGPQTRLFTSLKAEFNREKKFFDKADIIIGYQNISEDRITRKFNKTSKAYRLETVDVGTINIDMFKQLSPENELRYGAEAIYNYVSSEAYAKNIETGEIFYNISSRYPDAGNTMNTFAGYITHNWEINKKVIFTQGMRYSYVSLNSEYTDTMMAIMKFPFDKRIEQRNSAINGSIGLVYSPTDDWRFTLLGSSGFRAANVDDVGKVNDSKAKDRLLIVPNPDVKPEYAYNADFTISKTFNKTVQLEATGFYTLLDNAIVCRPFEFNGEDSVMFDGVLCEVQANTNAAEAYLYGFQGNVLAQASPNFSILSNLTYTYGWVKTDSVPLDHIPPIYGLTSFNLKLKKFTGEFFIRYNGWKKVEDYSPTGEDNIEEATKDGCPPWYTLNIRMGYQINKFFNIQVGLENIMDVHYRQFASGVSAPGRNLIVALRGSF